MSRLKDEVLTHEEKRLKVFFYGAAKTGKTTTAINFPAPYIIDTESGSNIKDYVDIIRSKGGMRFSTIDFHEVVEKIKQLMTEEHPYKTIIIDPLTIIYQSLCDEWADKLARASTTKGADGTEFQRHRDKADTQMKQLFRLLTRIDMNVVITSHAKVLWKKEGNTLVEMGNIWDCFKKADYLFDLIFETQRRGENIVAIVKATRYKNQFPMGTTIPFNYDEIASRFGYEIIEKEVQIEELATSEQIIEVKQLIELLKVPEDLWKKWIEKTDATEWDEMNRTHLHILIDKLNKKLKGKQQ